TIPPSTKLVVWQNLDEGVKQRIWPQVAPYLDSQASSMGFVFATAFPPPTGSKTVDEIIAELRERRAQEGAVGPALPEDGPRIIQQ
ncbi:MAG: hypothetical protein AAF743_11370, partial [Planctomycetota bacterium]